STARTPGDEGPTARCRVTLAGIALLATAVVRLAVLVGPATGPVPRLDRAWHAAVRDYGARPSTVAVDNTRGHLPGPGPHRPAMRSSVMIQCSAVARIG